MTSNSNSSINFKDSRPGEYRVSDQAQLTQCRSCHAPIYWTHMSKNGRPIPLSAATIRLDAFGARYALNHFSDCPNAQQHRRTDAPASDESSAPVASALPGVVDLRDLPAYLARHHLVVTGSTVTDAGDGRLHVELQTRRE